MLEKNNFLCYAVTIVERFGYKILLFFLRSLVRLKRVVVWLYKRFLAFWNWLDNGYQKTVGFWLHKFIFKLGRVTKVVAPWGGHFFDFFCQRSVLQIVLVLIGLLMIAPQSRWYTSDDHTPGKRTLLYSLIGPGDQDFELEEISVETIEAPIQPARTWREGAIAPDLSLQGRTGVDFDNLSVSLGGTALNKPILLPGASTTGIDGRPQADRTTVVQYVVQPGDVIGTIASRHGVGVATVLWANNLTARSLIRPGDTLKIPPVDGVIHQVKKGDSVVKIAKTYGAKEEDIIRINKLQEGGADIRIGEELIVPGGKKIQVAPAPQRRYTVLSDVAAPPASSDLSSSGFIWPTSVRRITQYFGLRHTGVDIAGPVGTPLYAAKSGIVLRSSCGWNGGYGCYVILDHGGGVQTLYGHANQLLVQVGEQVSQGQVVARMGSTGRSTGPHIHFEVRINGRFQNPLRYIR